MAGRPKNAAISYSFTTTNKITLPKALRESAAWPENLKLTLAKRAEGDYVLVPDGQTLETA